MTQRQSTHGGSLIRLFLWDVPHFIFWFAGTLFFSIILVSFNRGSNKRLGHIAVTIGPLVIAALFLPIYFGFDLGQLRSVAPATIVICLSIGATLALGQWYDERR